MMDKKPTGLAKIWREIKRPVTRLIQSHVNRSIAERNKNVIAISPQHPFQRRYIQYFLEHKDQIQSIKAKLLAGMDQLSHDVVNRVSLPYEMLLAYGESFLQTPDSRLEFYYSLSAEESQAEEEEKLRAAKATIAWKQNKIKYRFLHDQAYEAYYGKHRKISCDTRTAGDVSHHETIYGLKLFNRAIKVQEKDIIDGGGYNGDTALFFLELQPKKVHIFEPDTKSQQLIEQNLVKAGQRDKCCIQPQALFSTSGTLSFFTPGGLSAGASILSDIFGDKALNYEVKVPCISIDDYVSRENLDVGLIKLNIEGAEYDAIQGATNTIKKFRPIMAIDLYHTAKDFFEIKPYLESLNLGYRFYVRQQVYMQYWQECIWHTLFAWPD